MKRELASLLASILEAKAWTGRGDGGAIRESTGREPIVHRRNQKRFRKERRKACGPALSSGKTDASWFREARRRLRALVGIWKYSLPLYFLKSEGGKAGGYIDRMWEIC